LVRGAPWDRRQLSNAVLDHLPQLLRSPEAPVCAALDDTLLKKTGRRIPGVKILREGLDQRPDTRLQRWIMSGDGSYTNREVLRRWPERTLMWDPPQRCQTVARIRWPSSSGPPPLLWPRGARGGSSSMAISAVQIWVCTAFALVPTKVFTFSDCFHA
jgi:hypothetical protein